MYILEFRKIEFSLTIESVIEKGCTMYIYKYRK